MFNLFIVLEFVRPYAINRFLITIQIRFLKVLHLVWDTIEIDNQCSGTKRELIDLDLVICINILT